MLRLSKNRVCPVRREHKPPSADGRPHLYRFDPETETLHVWDGVPTSAMPDLMASAARLARKVPRPADPSVWMSGCHRVHPRP